MIIWFMLWLFCPFLSWKMSEEILAVMWIMTSPQREIRFFLFNIFIMCQKKLVRFSRIHLIMLIIIRSISLEFYVFIYFYSFIFLFNKYVLNNGEIVLKAVFDEYNRHGLLPSWSSENGKDSYRGLHTHSHTHTAPCD